MPEFYKKRYGIDFTPEMSDLFIDLTLAKKWRYYRDIGWDVSGFDPGNLLEKSVRALWPASVKMTPWTIQILHDFAAEDKYAMVGCGSCGKSFAMAACGICYWIVDPYDTAVVVGSATLTDLRTRAWAPTLTLFTELKNSREFAIPGKICNNVYAIVNERDQAIEESMAAKASIQGRAMEEGRVQGLHLPWVLFIVDELALIKDIEALKTSYANTRIGTLGWKTMTAANPDPWDSPNSCFYLPPRGVVVDVDTGAWRSQMGYFVRHFDGLKSPVVQNPKLKFEYPFLMSEADVKDTLLECNGDENHPRFWKMVRGFPLHNGLRAPTVLDPIVAAQSRACQPLDPPMLGSKQRLGMSAGADPAWSEGGDDAIYAGCEIVEQDGRVYLDFSGRVSKLPISVKAPDPVTKQLRDGVVMRIHADGGPVIKNLYVDSSGNQGLADDIDIYVGRGCGHVNSSVRASENPLRHLDDREARSHIYDRGTEAWCVLAEFVKAGQVRGLPQRALDALAQRRFMTRPKSNDAVQPLRLEAKEVFIGRFKASPNETDACALAALAAKERLGVLPFGGVPPPQESATLPDSAPKAAAQEPLPAEDYGSYGGAGAYG